MLSIASKNKPPHSSVGRRQRDNQALVAATIYLNVPIMIAAYWGGAALERRHRPQNKAEMYQCAETRGDARAVCGGEIMKKYVKRKYIWMTAQNSM